MNYATTPNTANHAAMRPTTPLRHALIYSVAVLRCDCLSEESGGVAVTMRPGTGLRKLPLNNKIRSSRAGIFPVLV
jgi:hypothetical protein